jgi:hypothetical protein
VKIVKHDQNNGIIAFQGLTDSKYYTVIAMKLSQNKVGSRMKVTIDRQGCVKVQFLLGDVPGIL